jgi:ABC-type multidrug transport system fused ATPase/permease subunit
VRELRRRIHSLVSDTSASSSSLEAEGIQASMIVAEVEPIGSFVGGSVSEPLLQAGILCSVLAYMIHVDLRMAAVAILFFVPQLIFVPMMQHAMNRRTRVRVRLIRLLSISIVSAPEPERDSVDEARIDRIFRLNMGVYKFKFSMNFLMNLSTQLQVIGALAVGSWAVLHDQLEIGGVVAFISGIGRITDPWGDLVNYFRDANINQVKFALLRDAIRVGLARRRLGRLHRGQCLDPRVPRGELGVAGAPAVVGEAEVEIAEGAAGGDRPDRAHARQILALQCGKAWCAFFICPSVQAAWRFSSGRAAIS